MSESAETTQLAPKKKSKNLLSWVIIGLSSFVLATPAFVILHQYVPPLYTGGFRVDKIVTFLPIYFLIFYIIVKFRVLFYVLMAGGLVWLTVETISGNYSFKNLIIDYKSMMHSLNNGAVKIQFLEEHKEFTNEERIREAIDYNNPDVRNYAVHIAAAHFKDYSERDIGPGRKVIHAFSVFKELRHRWVYVHDPQFEDYYAKASETVLHVKEDGSFKGDCDDYSILMAACIQAVGGEVRLVRTRVEKDDGTTVGHIYPEVYIGDVKDLESATYLIQEKFFEKWASNKEIYYYLEEDGSVWLNFDYNDNYPGGRYQSRTRISEIEIGN